MELPIDGMLDLRVLRPEDCDDFAFDVHGSLYCGTDPFNTLLRILPDGLVETLLTASDGLDGPTAAAFGHQGDRFELYVTNAAFPFFDVPPPRRPLDAG